MPKKDKTYKVLTIRLPVWIWKALKTQIRDGKIKSIQQVVVELLEMYLEGDAKNADTNR